MQNNKIQNQQKKKSTSNVAKLMAQMDHQKNGPNENADYQEEMNALQKPRSKEYIRLVQEQKSMSLEMIAIEKQLKTVEDALIQEDNKTEEERQITDQNLTLEQEKTKPDKVDHKGISEEELIWWDENKKTVEETIEEKKKNEANIPKSKRDLKKEKLEQEKQELLLQFQELQQKMEESRAALELQYPAVRGRLGIIYPEMYTERLKNYGLINVSGTNYYSKEELLKLTQPQTEQEKSQWLKADDAFKTNIEKYTFGLLDVEVYVYAICIVFVGGDTITIKD